MRRTLLPSLVLALSAARSARAHDLWLLPPAGAQPGKACELRAASGSVFPVSENALAPDRVVRTLLLGPSGEKGALGPMRVEKEELLLAAAPAVEGAYVAGIETAPRVLSLPASEFDAYLLHDGLPDVHAWRKANGRLESDAVERYSKFAKAIFRAGPSGAPGRATEALGLALEVVPLADPLGLRAGDDLPIRVLFRGAPLASAVVSRDQPGDGDAFAASVRTDAKGETKVPLGGPGLSTLRLVHMTRPAAPDHEWESFWASLTFEVAPKGARRP